MCLGQIEGAALAEDLDYNERCAGWIRGQYLHRSEVWDVQSWGLALALVGAPDLVQYRRPAVM